MKKNRPAVVTASEDSNWLSCRSITPAIIEACKIAFGEELDFFSYCEPMTPLELEKLARNVWKAKPSRLIFTDHRPHPLDFFKALIKVSGGVLPTCTFHIYGDFTLFTEKWRQLEPLLKGTPVSFLCASGRQALLLKRFLKRGNDDVRVCPFPVNSALYTFDGAGRKRVRARLGIGEDEYAVVYAGRHSLQKNITWLLHEFASFAASSPRAVRLLLAGPFDELGAPFFIRPELTRGYFFEYQRTLNQLPEVVRSRISYLGTLENESLRDLYLAGDVYASLSFHHDEDFGMAPAEALCCGMPAVLTDWGGFASFQELSAADVDLIPVRMTSKGLRLKKGELAHALAQIMRRAESDEKRMQRSKRFQDLLSIQSAAAAVARLEQHCPKGFLGFNNLLKEHARLAQNTPMFLNDKRNVYRQVYSAYLENPRANELGKI